MKKYLILLKQFIMEKYLILLKLFIISVGCIILLMGIYSFLPLNTKIELKEFVGFYSEEKTEMLKYIEELKEQRSDLGCSIGMLINSIRTNDGVMQFIVICRIFVEHPNFFKRSEDLEKIKTEVLMAIPKYKIPKVINMILSDEDEIEQLCMIYYNIIEENPYFLKDCDPENKKIKIEALMTGLKEYSKEINKQIKKLKN